MDYKSLEEAVQKLKEIVQEQGLVPDFLYVLPDSVFSFRKKLYIHSPSSNSQVLESLFIEGLNSGFGMSMSVIAMCDNRLLVTLNAPQNLYDADGMLLSPKYLKFSILSNLQQATIIRNKLHVLFIKVFGKRGRF